MSGESVSGCVGIVSYISSHIIAIIANRVLLEHGEQKKYLLGLKNQHVQFNLSWVLS